MMEGMNDGWGMGNAYGWLTGLIVLVVVIGVIVIALQHRKNSTKSKYNSPQDIW